MTDSDRVEIPVLECPVPSRLGDVDTVPCTTSKSADSTIPLGNGSTAVEPVVGQQEDDSRIPLRNEISLVRNFVETHVASSMSNSEAKKRPKRHRTRFARKRKGMKVFMILPTKTIETFCGTLCI
jgi:hypothetical protein